MTMAYNPVSKQYMPNTVCVHLELYIAGAHPPFLAVVGLPIVLSEGPVIVAYEWSFRHVGLPTFWIKPSINYLTYQ